MPRLLLITSLLLSLLAVSALSHSATYQVDSLAVRRPVVVTRRDSMPPTNLDRRFSSPPLDGVALAAGVVGAAGLVVGLFALVFGNLPLLLVLIAGCLALGIWGVMRIRRSQGTRGGRFLAWFAILTGTFWLTATVLTLLRVLK